MPFYFRSIVILLIFSSFASATQAQSFEHLLASALQHNRSLTAGYQEWEARKQGN